MFSQQAFIQSDLRCIQVIHLYCQYMCFLGIEPTTFALLTQCFTTEPQEHHVLCLKKCFSWLSENMETSESYTNLQLNVS